MCRSGVGLFLKISLVYTALIANSLLVGGCGVKGKPLPPIEPVIMGRGGPSYSGLNQNSQPEQDEKKREEVQ